MTDSNEIADNISQFQIFLSSINEYEEKIELLLKNKILFDENQFDLIIKYLQRKLDYHSIENQKLQRLTTHFENQLINVKNLGKQLNLFSSQCRSLIIYLLNIRQNSVCFTSNHLEHLTIYSPSTVKSHIISTLFPNSAVQLNQDSYNYRLQCSNVIINYLKQINRYRLEISILYELLIKSVLPKSERFHEIEHSLYIPSNIFISNRYSNLFSYEISQTKQHVYIQSEQGQLQQNHIRVTCIENGKHSLSQINYRLCEKYSYIYDIEFERVIYPIDKLKIAIPCFDLSTYLQSNSFLSKSQQQHIYIRCKRIIDPLTYIPARIEIYNEISYAIFSLTQSLSSISVEAVLLYPFEILRISNNDTNCVYTSEHSSVFRVEAPKNYFIHSPRIRMIPFNSELIRCTAAWKTEDQLLDSSDFIEFEWHKDLKAEGIVSITIPLTRHFDSLNENNDDQQQQRRERNQRRLILQRKKFEQEKYDENGGSLNVTPRSTVGLNSPTVISDLPNMSNIIERALNDNQENIIKLKFNFDRDDNSQSASINKTLFKWKLDGFKNENAPIILLGYKNRKWRNLNNFVTIAPAEDEDIYKISLTSLFDRLILVRCWPESANEGRFDKLAENLWSLSSTKLFACVLARNPTFTNNFGHYALMIVPIEKQMLAEDTLRKRNYTEFLYDEQSVNETYSKIQLKPVNSYQSHHMLTGKVLSNVKSSKYVQFCLSEGTYIRIAPLGNIDIHEKIDLNFRLHAQHPIIIEFDIYPIDIYRQKTDDHFIGTLNLYQINSHSILLESTSSTLTATVASSRTSSDSKDTEMLDGVPMNSSPRTSINVPEYLHSANNNVGRIGFEKLINHDLNDINLVCSIRIRLPKSAFQLPSTKSTTIPIDIPDYFLKVLQMLTEGKREFAEALHIHPALMNSLFVSQQQRDIYSQSNTLLPITDSRLNLSKNISTQIEQTKLENDTLVKWLKRQCIFDTNRIIDNIISALIHIGRVDLAYMFKVDTIKTKCENTK